MKIAIIDAELIFAHDVVDLGVPVLSMHAPFEIISKIDIYMAYRAFFAFFN